MHSGYPPGAGNGSKGNRPALSAFLNGLPQETRRIFLRRYYHADTIAEIAARYCLTESKVKMQLSRTRAKLCTYLEQEGIQV